MQVFFNQFSVRGCVTLLAFALSVLLSACSSMNSAMDKVKNIDLWPFDSTASNDQARAYRPINSIEYQCDKNKRFFIRMLDKGDTVWLITKEREIALAKSGASEYKRDAIVLNLGKDSAELTMTADTPYTQCKLVPLK